MIAALQKVQPFRAIERAEVAEIARHAADRRLAPGEALFGQGEPADRFFLAVEGRLKVIMITPEGKQVLVRLLYPGDFCGLAPALTRSDYPATCRAIVAVRVVGWPTSHWAEVIETHPRLAVGLTQSLGRHIADVHTRIAELATENVEQRIANAVLRLARKTGPPVEGGVRIDFPITRQDLADLTGTTLHSVSRIVSGWVGRGVIGGGRARLVVRDVPALERVARGEKG